MDKKKKDTTELYFKAFVMKDNIVYVFRKSGKNCFDAFIEKFGWNKCTDVFYANYSNRYRINTLRGRRYRDVIIHFPTDLSRDDLKYFDEVVYAISPTTSGKIIILVEVMTPIRKNIDKIIGGPEGYRYLDLLSKSAISDNNCLTNKLPHRIYRHLKKELFMNTYVHTQIFIINREWKYAQNFVQTIEGFYETPGIHIPENNISTIKNHVDYRIVILRDVPDLKDKLDMISKYTLEKSIFILFYKDFKVVKKALRNIYGLVSKKPNYISLRTTAHFPTVINILKK